MKKIMMFVAFSIFVISSFELSYSQDQAPEIMIENPVTETEDDSKSFERKEEEKNKENDTTEYKKAKKEGSAKDIKDQEKP